MESYDNYHEVAICHFNDVENQWVASLLPSLEKNRHAPVTSVLLERGEACFQAKPVSS